MKEFIFTLEDLFVADKLLNDLESDQYYIGAYQRGFKWKSFGPNDQVPLFLTDIYGAYKDQAHEYYLQYITIKKNDIHKRSLEVIDGQQRLTTISLLFYSFSKCFSLPNITENKVQYERYQNRQIFDEIIDLDAENESSAVLLKKHQDIYYIYHAKVCIMSFLNLLSETESRLFYNFCRERVKIIINLEDEMTAAEEIFSNLNGNKVDLTNYYLIKGLLFTKSTRTEHQKQSFNEIQAQRNRIARNWDDIDNWLRDDAQNQLFFYGYPIINNKEQNIGINSLLNVLKPTSITDDLSSLPIIYAFIKKLKEVNKSNVVDDYKLFNIYNDGLKTQPLAEAHLLSVHQASKRLRNWFADNELHNLIGFYICASGELNDILDLGPSELKAKLYQHLKNVLLLKNKDIASLNYEDDAKKLNIIFLALNVFTLKNIGNKPSIDFYQRFDFKSYRDQKWSIEHIYPQNPDCSENDYNDFYDWFLEKGNKSQNEQVKDKIKKRKKLSSEELREMASQQLDGHQLGNLALLGSGNNSTLKNYIFPKKRKLLLKLITQGAFVPQHTINAVAKLLNNVTDSDKALSFSTNLTEWEENDIAANAQWIGNTYNNLLKIVSEK